MLLFMERLLDGEMSHCYVGILRTGEKARVYEATVK